MSIRTLKSASTAELRTLAATHRDAVVHELGYRARPGARKLAAELGCVTKSGAPAPKRAPAVKTRKGKRACTPAQLAALARGRAKSAANREAREAKAARIAFPQDFAGSGGDAGDFASIAHDVRPRARRTRMSPLVLSLKDMLAMVRA